MILTRQTCGQRSGMPAGGKRWALAFYFSVRICYMFRMSKCRGEFDLGLCMTSVLAKRMPLRSADLRFLNVLGHKIRRRSALRSGIFFASTEVMHRLRSDFRLHFDIKNTWQIRTEKRNASARHWLAHHAERRMFATSRSRLNHCWTIDLFPQKRTRSNA